MSYKTFKLLAGVVSIFAISILLTACGSTPAGLSAGNPAPAFSLPASDGSTVTLENYTGKQPVLLFFHMAVG